MKGKVVFYANDTLKNIEYFEYYKQDIVALEKSGFNVLVINRYRDIPFDCDIIFVWWWSYALVPIIFSKIMRKKSVITGTFNYSSDDSAIGYSYQSKPFWQKFLIKLALKLTDVNLFANKKELIEIVRDFNLKNLNYWLPHSIQDSYFNEGLSKISPPFILNISWRGKKNLIRKGIPELLEGFKYFHDKHPNIKLVLAGMMGDGSDFLKEMIDKFNLGGCVIDYGEVDINLKKRLLRDATIYIQPSHYEGFGLAIAEAMASSCAIISTDVGGIPYVTNGCAKYVEPGCPEQISEALIELINSDNLCKDMGASAYRQAQSLSLDFKIDFYKKLYSLDA